MSIKPTKRDLHSQETKRRIVEAAKELFAEYGFESVGVKDIAEKAGVTTGALYYHFKNKDDIFIAVFSDNNELFLKSAEEFKTSTDPMGDLIEFLSETMVKRVEDDGEDFTRYRVLRHFDFSHPSDFDTCLYQLVHRGIELGCFKEGLSEEELADSFAAVYRGAIYQLMMSAREVDARQLIRQRLRLLIEGVGK